jgi:hypothetical protein
MGPPRADIGVVPKKGIRDVTVLSAENPNLICCICLRVLDDAVSCKDGHSLCRACVEGALESGITFCPMDRAPLRKKDLRPVLLTRGLVDELQVQCPLGNKTCEHVCRFGVLEGHMKECVLRDVQCGDCAEVFSFASTAEHKGACPKFPLQCEHCPLFYARSEMEQHLRFFCDVCPSTLEGCVVCDEEVPRSEMVAHVEENVSDHFQSLAERFDGLHTSIWERASKSEVEGLKCEVEGLRSQLIQSGLEMLSLKKELR